MKHALPEHPVFRPGTVDKDVWAEVVESNCYRLPDWFSPGDQVMDLGGHTGSFAWRCANSGASVLTVEPSRENYHLILHNLRPVWDRVVCLHAAAWRSDRPVCLLPFQPNWVPANTGGGCVMGDASTQATEAVAVPLDDLLRLKPSWRLLKLDVEGAEFPILYTAKELARVREIAGEYHARRESKPFADAGRPCAMDALREHLQGQGFRVEVEPKGEGMGLFFAHR